MSFNHEEESLSQVTVTMSSTMSQSRTRQQRWKIHSRSVGRKGGTTEGRPLPQAQGEKGPRPRRAKKPVRTSGYSVPDTRAIRCRKFKPSEWQANEEKGTSERRIPNAKEACRGKLKSRIKNEGVVVNPPGSGLETNPEATASTHGQMNRMKSQTIFIGTRYWSRVPVRYGKSATILGN